MKIIELTDENTTKLMRHFRHQKLQSRYDIEKETGMPLARLNSMEMGYCKNIDFIVRYFRYLGVDEIRIDTRRWTDGT